MVFESGKKKHTKGQIAHRDKTLLVKKAALMFGFFVFLCVVCYGVCCDVKAKPSKVKQLFNAFLYNLIFSEFDGFICLYCGCDCFG